MTVTAGGAPSKGTDADRRLKRNRSRQGQRLIAAAKLARWEATIGNAVRHALTARQSRVLGAVRSKYGAVTAAVMPVDPFDEATWDQTVLSLVKPAVDGVVAEIKADLAGTLGTDASTLPPITFGDPSDLLLSQFSKLGADTAGKLTDTLFQGTNAGESIPELAARVRDVFDSSLARSTVIARTEVSQAANSLALSYGQAVNNAGIQLRKSWLDSPDSCPECSDLAGDDPIPVDQVFSSGDDAPPAHPSCFPGWTSVAGARVVASTKRWYVGDLVEVVTSAGNLLAVTPNHPVLTPQGWVPAGGLYEGGYVLRCPTPERVAALVDPDHHHGPALIKQVAVTLGRSSAVPSMRMPSAPEDFHGDGIGSQVHVVRADGLLRDRRLEMVASEPVGEEHLVWADPEATFLPGLGPLTLLLEAMDAATGGVVRGDSASPVLVGAPAGSFKADRLGNPANLDSVPDQVPGDRRPTHAVSPSQAIDALASEVTLDRVVATGRRPFAGHVYNLQTTTGWLVSDGIVTHNCRCTVVFETVEGVAVADATLDDAALALEGE